MKINYYAIRSYLSWLTEGRAASDPEAGDDWSLYQCDMDQMIREARAKGDEVLLRCSIDSLVARPEGRIHEFSGQVRAFDDDDLADLFRAAFEYLWPERLLSEPSSAPNYAFVPMSDEEWAARRG